MTDAADALELEDSGGQIIDVEIAPGEAGERLDKVLAARLPELSRARIQALIAGGALSLDGHVVTAGAGKAQGGAYRLVVPAPEPAEPEAEALPLTILYEDEHLIVLDKVAGMAVHPAPGSASGTLVNALLHHCAGRLSGIGGIARPGIVHRLDKDTSGVMVVTKTDAAHAGLSALFARHDIERRYIALVRSSPDPASGTIRTRIGRSPHDRKKMAVLRSGGREAVTHYKTECVFGAKPLASRIACELETGRTHQIRVHLAAKGSPCLGDLLYGSGTPAPAARQAIVEAGLRRQALHASVLGFVHPITGKTLRFETAPPEDMARLEGLLTELR